VLFVGLTFLVCLVPCSFCIWLLFWLAGFSILFLLSSLFGFPGLFVLCLLSGFWFLFSLFIAC